MDSGIREAKTLGLSRYVPDAHCDHDGWAETNAECQNCEKRFPRYEMKRTYDCQGIPFRRVCHTCYDRMMAKGYDGQYYDERDECLDYDY